MDGKVASLSAMRLFDSWTLAELRRLAKAADVVDVPAGTMLVRAGAWHAGCYVLLAGAVVTTTVDGVRLTASAGDFVGLAETLAGVAAEGETVALRTSQMLAFTTNGFVSALETIRPLRRFAFTQLATAQLAPARTSAQPLRLSTA
jgi:CRP-like cAMP-binding protein